jgi:succinate dehydrogenase / fumarate reductase cytochrome b subunit
MESTMTAKPHSSTFPFWWSRLGSFLSILPLGVWTVCHLWDNLAAFEGARAWETTVTGYPHPFGHIAVMVIVFLPLLIHTAWGIQRLASFTPNNQRYGYFGNTKYLLQRLAAIGVLAFLIAHIWLALVHPRLVEGHAEAFSDIASEMHFHGPTLVVYLLGTLGVAYHLANGLFGFGWTWGLIQGRRSFRITGAVAVIVFLILLVMSWGVIYAMYQAGAHFPPHHPLD